MLTSGRVALAARLRLLGRPLVPALSAANGCDMRTSQVAVACPGAETPHVGSRLGHGAEERLAESRCSASESDGRQGAVIAARRPARREAATLNATAVFSGRRSRSCGLLGFPFL